MIHHMKLCKEPFESIKNRNKTIELRLLDEKRQLVNVGDTIVFTNLDNTTEIISARVISLYKYNSFEELYSELSLLKCGYTESNVHTAKPKDMEQYYSKDQQRKYGVVGIEITLIEQ